MYTKKILFIIISLIFIKSKIEAQIVYVDIPDTNFNYPSIDYLGNETNNYTIDINNDNVVDCYFSLHKWQTWETPSAQPIQYVCQLWAGNGSVLAESSSSNCVGVLSEGETIDINKDWTGMGDIYVDVIGFTFGCNIPFYDKYYGVELNINNSTHFGWLHLDVSSIGEVVLKGYAYNTSPNETIVAGDTILSEGNDFNYENFIDKDELLKLYPVPFSDILKIEIQNIATPVRLKIRNMIGEVVKEFVLNTSIYSTELSSINRGIYFLTIENENEVLITKKIIKN